MKTLPTLGLIGSLFALGAVAANAAELQDIEQDEARSVAKQLMQTVGNLKDLQFSIDADAEKASGMRIRKEGLLIVPARGISEDKKPETVSSETGAGFAYLFFSEHFTPLVNGQPADAKSLRTVKVTDKEGTEREIKCFLLSARQTSGDDWKLCVFGSAKKPLVEASFGDASVPQEGAAVSLRVSDVQGTQGKLKIVVFGKYEAPIDVTYSGE